MQEGACREKSERIGLRCEDLPFSRIPGQTRLFLQYLSDPASLRKYYPSAVSEIRELVSRKEEVLANHLIDRNAMCEVLMDQHTRFGGGPESAANILKLKERDCVAVLTGQQAGLFTGPLYTIYKAVSAIRIAEELNVLGVKAVPVFWIATEDHDFEEVSSAIAVGIDGGLTEARYNVPEPEQGKPVGTIEFDVSIRSAIADWIDLLPPSVSTSEFAKLLGTAYRPGSNFGIAFGRTMAALFERFGLIIFDPLEARVKRLSAPIVKNAIERSEEIATALKDRSEKLVNEGFHAQVLVGDDYFPLFSTDDAGKRHAIKRSGDRKFTVASNRKEISSEELIASTSDEPERYSAGVMLRPVVQDFIFPTICYVGGAAEIAYFAQNSEVYGILERPVTPILHRQSFTIVERKHSRTLEKYGLKFEDIFRGFDALLPEIIERVIDPETPRIFRAIEERINSELNALDQQLSVIDPTLAANLATRRRKINYHFAALRTKFERTRIRKDEIADRRLRSLFAELYPNNGLQERTLNLAHFANAHGVQFIDWICDSVDVDNKDHRILYL